MKNKTKTLVPISLMLLGMLYLIFIILCYLFSSKEMALPLHIISAPGVVAYSIAVIIIDIIAEVYGYRIAKLIFWFSLITQAIFCLFCFLFSYMPDTKIIPGIITAQEYQIIFNVLPRVYLSCLIGMLLGILINAKLIAKWKVLLNGKHFWLRSIAASGIGEAIFVFTSTFLAHAGNVSLLTILKLSMADYLILLFILAILAPIANIIMYALKLALKDSLQYTEFDYNPFKKVQDNI